jgi:hypothetical protein
MPVIKCSNGKYRIGDGQCMYHSKEKAERAYKAYLAQSHMNEDLDGMDIISMDVPLFIRMLEFAKEDAKTDMDLHKATENILDLLVDNKILNMDNYNDIVGDIKMSKDNVMQQCNEALKLLEGDSSNESYKSSGIVTPDITRHVIETLQKSFKDAIHFLNNCDADIENGMGDKNTIQKCRDDLEEALSDIANELNSMIL